MLMPWQGISRVTAAPALTTVTIHTAASAVIRTRDIERRIQPFMPSTLHALVPARM
jgi:hypothetical protein